MLEDNKFDAELIKRELKGFKLDFNTKNVDSRNDFIEAIENYKPDLILSDYNLPHFTGFEALEISKNNAPTIPFILITGTLSEEMAAESIKNGAWDYILKENLLRLGPAIEGALKLKEEKVKNEIVQKELLKLHAAVEQSANMILITDINGNIEYTNPKFTEVTGYSAKEVLGKNPRILNTGSDNKEQFVEMWQTIAAGKIWKGEFHNKTKSGELFWEQVTITPLEDNTGKIINFLAIKEDITERKEREEKIKRSDDILSQVNSLVMVIDKNKNITYASPSFKTIVGFEPEEMLGLGWWIRTTPDLATAIKVRETVLNAEINKIPTSDEIENRWIKDINGTPKLFQWSNSKSNDGSLIFIGIDITEKYEKERQFKTLTETAQDAIILVDHKGIIFEWNKSSQKIFGYTKEEIIGKSIKKLVLSKYWSEYKNDFTEFVNNISKLISEKSCVDAKTKDGRIIPIELALNSWYSKNEKIYCCFIRDLTKSAHEAKIKQVIFNITKKANENLEFNQFLPFVKIELGKLINTNNFFVAIHNEKTGMITSPYMIDEYDKNVDFPKGKSLTGHIIDTKKALLTKENAGEHGIKGQKTTGLGPPSKCWLGVPLLVDEEAIGAIVVQSYTDENAYTQNDVALLELISSNIAVIIKKTQDLDQINLLGKVLIQSQQSVIITNINSKVEYTNPAFTKISGYSEAEVLGETPNILQSNYHTPKNFIELWNTINQGKIWEGEFVSQRKDGSKYLVNFNISSVKNKDGEISQFIIVQDDITEKRKLESQFLNAFIEAQEIEKLKFGEELHDGISQILSAESMYISLLIQNNLDRIKDKAKFLIKIKELNARAIKETRNVAHGLMSSELKKNGLLIAVEIICSEFNDGEIKFDFCLDNINEDDFSNSQKAHLFRIIQELTTNINRYSSATKASVEFNKLDQNKIKVIVKDNGIGMDFNTIKKDGKFTGLQNVERRIDILNGNFEVESAPKKGTKWDIEIPILP